MRPFLFPAILFCFIAGTAVIFPFMDIRAADDVANRVAGRILIDVDSSGKAWYVSPADRMRYELGRPEQAWEVMRTFGLGVRNADISQIPAHDEHHTGSIDLRQRLAGRILLQVESRGEAWYVHPVDMKRYYLGRPADAFAVMRELGLGIKSSDLGRITVGTAFQTDIPDVSFYAQAPRGKWNDLRQQEGCEEASVLMAVAWVRGQTYTDFQAEREIISMAEYQRNQYGYFIDTSAKDTYDRLFRGYFSFGGARYEEGVTVSDILDELSAGNIVVITANGRTLNNPYFVAGGPVRHMLVVLGYDHVNGEFITHEPGTSRGGSYRYSFQTIVDALNDYNSGEYAPLPQPPRTAMIVVSKE